MGIFDKLPDNLDAIKDKLPDNLDSAKDTISQRLGSDGDAQNDDQQDQLHGDDQQGMVEDDDRPFGFGDQPLDSAQQDELEPVAVEDDMAADRFDTEPLPDHDDRDDDFDKVDTVDEDQPHVITDPEVLGEGLDGPSILNHEDGQQF